MNIESLLAFIPMDRRLAMSKGLDLPNRSRGSVLFADISGFTPLTAALAQELGVQRGAEEVLNLINPVYESLIGELHHYGGSVMGFAGDSITCWIDGDDGRRAVAAALAMQRGMERFATVHTPSGTPIPLAIKVAVAAGDVRRFAVGAPEYQVIDVIAGIPLDDVAEAEGVAEKGEIIVTEGIVERLGDELAISEWRQNEAGDGRFAIVDELLVLPEPQPHDAVDVAAISEEQARPWVLPPVYQRLQTSGRFLAELRPSVALFLKFAGIDYDSDELAGEKLNAYVCWIQGVLARHEGYLIQLTIGDKGSYVYASFGAPVAHDDDAERAVAAALELQYPPPAFAHLDPAQIGISRGRVWAGECGALVRHTYGVMGNEVNMAARLMGKASPGQSLVRQRVADTTRRSYRYEPLGLMAVKGGAEPIAVSKLEGRQTNLVGQQSLYEEDLVGRGQELTRLDRAMDEALAQSGQTIILTGEPGIGKSHLLASFAERAAANGFQVAAVACQRMTQATTYFPWQQIMAQILGLPGPDSSLTPDETEILQIEAIDRTLGDLNPEWMVRLPLLGDLFGLAIPDNATTAAFEPRQRQEALFALVVEILRFWARSQPLILAIDNTTWMDEASVALTESAARALSGNAIMLVLVARTMTPSQLTESIEALENYRNIVLGELSAEAMGELLEQLIGGPTSPLAHGLIKAKAQGNPFYARELIDSLKESGQLVESDSAWALSSEMFQTLRSANALVRDAGAWVLSESADLASISLGIPDSIHGVILARIDRLPESHKPTLKVASVIGFTFDLNLVGQIHPAQLTGNRLVQQANVLENRDFIFHNWATEAAARAQTFTFRQQATQEVSYETLLYTQRRELHRSLASYLEQNSPSLVDQIAYHAYKGESWETAMSFQILAGRKAKQLFANIQSIEYFRGALISAGHLPEAQTIAERQEIHAGLGELLLNTDQYEEARSNLEIALRLAEELDDVDAQASVAAWIARSHELRGQYEPALEWIDRGLEALGDRITAAGLEMRLTGGLINTRQGDFRVAQQQALACLLAAEEIGEVSIMARAHNTLGMVAQLGGQPELGIEHYREALSLYETADNRHGQALVQNQIANGYFQLGQWTDAAHYYTEARSIFNQLGNLYNLLLADNNLGGIALGQGNFDQAQRLYRQALTTLEQIGGSLWVIGALNSNLGATYIRSGELELAFEYLEASQKLFEHAGVRDDLVVELYRRLAEAYLAQTDFVKANEMIGKSESLAHELSLPYEEAHTRRVMGEIALRAGEYEAAEEQLTAAAMALADVSDEYGLALTQVLLSELYVIRAESERAREILLECLPVLERLGAAVELDTARRLLALDAGPS